MSQQFLVQLPNKPGELAHLARALCARGVNIVQIHQTTVGDLTSAEIYTDCCDEDTTDVLRGMGFPFVTGSSIKVEIEDSPCAFGELSDQLHHAGVAIQSCCVLGRVDGLATWALAVDHEDRARAVLDMPAMTDEVEGAESAQA
ncbi:MAG TPA: ACT domain-containing protein [Candidatus Limnocylindrales bacterium]